MGHLYKILIILILSFASFGKDLEFSDKVYFRIDEKYYSGEKIKLLLEQAKYFSCTFPDSIISKTLEFSKLNSISDETINVYENLIDYLRLLTFGKNLSSRVGVKIDSIIQDRLKKSTCQNKSFVENEIVAYKFMKIEKFLAARFIGDKVDKQTNKAIQDFYKSLEEQYSFEKFQ